MRCCSRRRGSTASTRWSRRMRGLKDLLDAQNSLGLSVQLARLVDVDLDPFRPRVVLNVGANQGVTVGQPVIDAHGIMGQVVEVLANTSVVMLVTDPTHAIPVMVERSGLRTIAYGTGAIDRLELPNIPISADVQVGDRLVTSGLGGRFPAGFPVGEILSITTDASSLFASAQARPAAALDRSDDVLLLRDQPQPYGAPAPLDQTGPPRESAGPAAGGDEAERGATGRRAAMTKRLRGVALTLALSRASGRWGVISRCARLRYFIGAP